MTRISLVVVALLIVVGALASPAAAQLVYPAPLYGYPPPQNVMALDAPAQGATVFQESAYFAGWAFGCNGTPPHELMLWVYTPNGPNGGDFLPWPSWAATGLHRPDVAQHYRDVGSVCRVTDYSGFHLYPSAPLPRGAVAYVILAYSPGGYFAPVTGLFVPGSAAVQGRFVLVK